MMTYGKEETAKGTIPHSAFIIREETRGHHSSSLGR
jgi:hypothetical protein